MGWLEKIHSEGSSISRVGLIPAYDDFMKWGNKNDLDAGLPQIWKVNGEINLPYLDSIKNRVSSVHSMPKYEGKVLILVGMGESLKIQIEYLRNLSDRFIICSTNSSCEYLLKHGVIPHYVILLDGRPGSWTMDLGNKAKDVTAIFGPCAEPEAIKAWPGEIIIVPLGVRDKSLNSKIRKRWGKPLPGGGNALNSGFAIFSLLTEIKIIMFVGNDLSFRKKYYGDGRKSSNDNSAYFFAKNVYGETVKTLIPLYEYKVWMETVMAQVYPEYHFIDCSGGILGVDTDGLVMEFCAHLPLEDAVKEVEEAFEIESKDLNFKLKYLYDQFYDHDLGNIQRGKGIWKHVIANTEFTKGLDVGCGRANGVQYARSKGYDVWGTDISSAAMKCWKERKVKKYCRVASADKMPFEDDSFDFIVCSEVMEHIPEEDTDATLKEILRVGSDKFLFTIALGPEKIPVAGLVQSHINIHEPNWWVRKFEEVGFYITGGAIGETKENISLLAVKYPDTYGKDVNKIFVDQAGNPTIPILGEAKEAAMGGNSEWL